MKRREFIRRLGVTGAAAVGATAGGFWLHDKRDGSAYFADQAEEGVVQLPSFRVDRGPAAVDLAISHSSDPDSAVRAAIGAMGGIETFISRGDRVLLKPNVAFDRPPILGATTNPEVLATTIDLCRSAGAAEILIADNPINQPEGCFFKSGIKQVADAAGARLILPRPSTFEQVRIDGDVLGTWPVFYSPLKDADKVIGISPCKDHNLCGGSMTMKNWYGMLGGRRNQFHQQIHGIVSDFPHLIRPTLVILDATRVLMRNGPTGGSISDVKAADTIVAGTDMVAVDTYGYGLLDRDPADLAYLHLAEKRELGTTDWKRLNWREVQA